MRSRSRDHFRNRDASIAAETETAPETVQEAREPMTEKQKHTEKRKQKKNIWTLWKKQKRNGMMEETEAEE